MFASICTVNKLNTNTNYKHTYIHTFIRPYVHYVDTYIPKTLHIHENVQNLSKLNTIDT